MGGSEWYVFSPGGSSSYTAESCLGSSVDVDILVPTFCFVRPLKSEMELSAPCFGCIGLFYPY